MHILCVNYVVCNKVYLYTNTVLDGCVTLCVCLFVIETTFPLSNFKTKHTFRILMERVTFLKPFGAPKATQFFFFLSFLSPPPKAAVAQMGTVGEGNPAEGGSSRVLL